MDALSFRADSYRKMLSKVRRSPSLDITGVRRSTSQAALDILLYLSPIEHYVRSVAARNLLRLYESSLVSLRRDDHTKILYEMGLLDQGIILD